MLVETVLASTHLSSIDSVAPRYITLYGKQYVLYSMDEDKRVLKMIVENRWLQEELDTKDSLLDIKEITEELLVAKSDNQYEIIKEKDLEIDILKRQNELQQEQLKEITKKAKRKKTFNKVLLGLGIVLTLGLVALAIIKK